MVVLRSSPNDMKQLLKFSNFYLKPNLRNNSVKTVNFEILKSRDIQGVSKVFSGFIIYQNIPFTSVLAFKLALL